MFLPLSHTTRNEKDYSGQARAGMTNLNTILPTPVRRDDIIMRKDGLNPSRSKEVRRVIAAHESLVMELQDMSVKKRRPLFTGRHLKRIRAGSMVARRLHLDRRYIPHNTTQKVKSRRMRLHVTQFMKRPDNSTLLPGIEGCREGWREEGTEIYFE